MSSDDPKLTQARHQALLEEAAWSGTEEAFAAYLAATGYQGSQPDGGAQVGQGEDLTVEKAKRALRAQLLDMFSASELRRFLVYGPQGDEIKLELPGESAPAAKIADAALDVLYARGLVTEGLLQRLLEERPRRQAEIRDVFDQLIRAGAMSPEPEQETSADEDAPGNVVPFDKGN